MIWARTAALSARLSGVSGRVSRSSFTRPQCRNASVELLNPTHSAPPTSSALPLRRLPRVPCMPPVVREKRAPLAELPRLQLLDRACHPTVDSRPSLRELREVSDLLGQRVLEAVLGLGIERFLVEELRVYNRMESGGQVSVTELDNASEYWLREVHPDHRCRLQ